jgi:hypothetical protein
VNSLKQVFLFSAIFALFGIPKVSGAMPLEEPPQEAPYVEEDEFSPSEVETSGSEAKASGIDEGPKKEISPEVSNDSIASVPDQEPQSVNQENKWALDHRNQIRAGRELISHPLSKKGLLAITKDGHYIYETNESRAYQHTGTLRFATMDSPSIKAADGTSFSTMYGGGSQSVLMFDYEWQPFTKYGKLGVQAGFGVIYARGQGRFDTTDPALKAQEAKEEYTFLALPLSLGVIYRLEWLKRQWFAPYASGGVTYFPVVEFRDDSKSPNAVGTGGAYGAGGMLLNISALDRETAFVFSSEYGISNLWVSLEYRLIQTLNKDLDFSSNLVSAGIAVDY